MVDHQLVVEKEIQLTVTTGNDLEGPDVIGPPLEYFASYPG